MFEHAIMDDCSIKLLLKWLGDSPPDLSQYFQQVSDRHFSGREDLELHLLPVVESLQWTQVFRESHPIINALGGVILDNANTSNHHIYLSAEACAGAVLYLDHDGDSRIVFSSLVEFVDAVEVAIANGRSLPSLHPKAAVLLPNQAGLSDLISRFDQGRNHIEGASEVIVAIIPSLSLTNIEQLTRLANDPDFFIAEAVGYAIASRPGLDLESVAWKCQQHSHPQASQAGMRAMKSISKLRQDAK